MILLVLELDLCEESIAQYPQLEVGVDTRDQPKYQCRTSMLKCVLETYLGAGVKAP